MNLGDRMDDVRAMFVEHAFRIARRSAGIAEAHRIALVEIDEYSLQNLEGAAGRWPWPRIVHASLIDFLARGPAKVVAYDVTFGAPDTRTGFKMGDDTLSGAESDRAFADAVKRAGNVLLLADATFNGEKTDAPPLPPTGFTLASAGVLERQTLLLPYPQLTAAAAGFGHNYFALDADGPLRHMVPFVRTTRGTALPSLGMAAALKAQGTAGDQVAMRDGLLTIAGQRIPLGAVRTRTADGLESFYWKPVFFRGPALLDDLKSRPYPSYTFYDLMYSEEQILAGEKPKVDPALFKDKIVFVGATASGLFDVFETPFERGKMPGIQVHAAVADDVLSGRTLAPISRTAAVFIVLGFSLAVGLLAAYLPAWWAVLATFALAGAYTWGAMVLFGRGSWLPLTEPMLSSSIALFGGVAYQYFVEGREKRKVAKLFGLYVSKDVYQQLMSSPAAAVLGGAIPAVVPDAIDQKSHLTLLRSCARKSPSVSHGFARWPTFTTAPSAPAIAAATARSKSRTTTSSDSPSTSACTTSPSSRCSTTPSTWRSRS